jgi:hypothetical protein
VDYAAAIAGQAGADGAEKLRNYLGERLRQDGINYVILGTDAPGIPVRYVNEPMAHDIDSLDRWPAELYYGMLENGWQPTVTPRPPMVPSVIVGRLPLRTPEQVYGYLGKVMNYEGGAWQAIKGKYLLTGVRCFYDTGEMTGKTRPADVFNDGLPQPREHATVTDGEIWSRRLFRDAPMLGNPPTEVKCLFDSVSSWDRVPGDYPITPERLLEKGNLGWEFLINATHGHFFGFMLRVKWGSDSPPPTFFSIDEAARMQHIFAVVTAVSCMSGGFDHEPDPCLSEALLRNPDGGALVYHGCSRLGLADSYDLYSGDSGWNILEFHQRITQGGFPGKTLGAAYVEQKINLAPLAYGGYPGKYDFFTLQYAVHYQGDPTLRCLPRPVTVGSKLSVAAGDVAGPGARFAAAPSLAATGVDLPGTRGVQPSLSKIRNGHDVRSGAPAYAADFQWNSRVKLWDEAGTMASRRAGNDAGSSLARLSGSDFQLWLTGPTADKQRLVAADAGLARLLRPVLWNISYTGKLARGTVLTVRGSFFGSARPVVYLEGRDATGAIRWLPCAVQAWYPFAAANGRPFASVMDPMTGESWLHCAYPAIPAGTVPTGWLILKNAVGIDAFPFPAAKPSAP